MDALWSSILAVALQMQEGRNGVVGLRSYLAWAMGYPGLSDDADINGYTTATRDPSEQGNPLAEKLPIPANVLRSEYPGGALVAPAMAQVVLDDDTWNSFRPGDQVFLLLRDPDRWGVGIDRSNKVRPYKAQV